MNTGIIIIFHNYEKHININMFIKQLTKAKNIQFCLVNNASRDNTYQLLDMVKEASIPNVSIIDIKKFKSDESAARAGARFMFNQFNLKHIGYLSTNTLNAKQYELNNIIKNISKNKTGFLNYNIESKKRTYSKKTLFQSLFSVIDYIKENKLIKDKK